MYLEIKSCSLKLMKNNSNYSNCFPSLFLALQLHFSQTAYYPSQRWVVLLFAIARSSSKLKQGLCICIQPPHPSTTACFCSSSQASLCSYLVFSSLIFFCGQGKLLFLFPLHNKQWASLSYLEPAIHFLVPDSSTTTNFARAEGS